MGSAWVTAKAWGPTSRRTGPWLESAGDGCVEGADLVAVGGAGVEAAAVVVVHVGEDIGGHGVEQLEVAVLGRTGRERALQISKPISPGNVAPGERDGATAARRRFPGLRVAIRPSPGTEPRRRACHRVQSVRCMPP